MAFNIISITAAGTDPLFAAITKMGGIWVNDKQNIVGWPVLHLMFSGNIPIALVIVIALNLANIQEAKVNGLVTSFLGLALVLTSFSIVLKKCWPDMAENWSRITQYDQPVRYKRPMCLESSLSLVPLSSVRAGAFLMSIGVEYLLKNAAC